MESFPVQFCRNIRLMWRRRRYQRIDGSSPGGGRKGLRIVKLGGGGGESPRRTWKLRRALRLRVRLLSPLGLLARVKDAYINAMLRLAGKSGGVSGFAAPDAFWAKRVPKARPARPAPPLDFETRILVEIYKSFLSPNQLAAL
ncbi:hypothetical protein Taro_034528 [Colocasia esculenta]|uniref:Uncharacterized protein n=1 Tax=Colocasia esculenta TaxID=4460 RepID=A0A843W376_COLES|nr:hypothetical protein [Colocasia esculenta]